jgi:adenylate cyclase
MVWYKVVNKLKAFGAKVIAFDVIFSEPELSRKEGEPSPDLYMAQAIADFQAIPGNKVIIPYYLTTLAEEQDDISFKELPGDLYNFVLNTKQANQDINLLEWRVAKTMFPVPNLLKAEPGLAHITADQDSDGVFRKNLVAVNVGDGIYISAIGVAAYQYFTGENTELEIDINGSAVLKTKKGNMEVGMKGDTLIRWAGSRDSFGYVSIKDLLAASDSSDLMKKKLKGKIVFIGSTATGAHDLRHTPIDSALPGVYTHMSVTSMLLQSRFFQPEEQSLYFSWIILIVGTLLMIGIQFFENAIFDAIFVILFGAGIFYWDTFHLIPQGHKISLFYCLFAVIGTYSWNTLLNYYLGAKDKAFLKNAFSNYISPELIDQMYESGEPPKLGGDCGIITAYFTDIQGFSSFSEKLSATRLVELLNEYLSAMTDILLEDGGTLDKYEGDAIIAFFGAPMPMEDHAVRSCRVALGMQERLADLREKWASEGDKWPPVVHEMRMRIGINTGEIVTGNMGSAVRMNYTMMGDSVNLAARLEEAAKQYGIFTQVSMFTKDWLEDKFVMRELDTMRVVGKKEPVTTYDLLGEVGKTDLDLLDLQKIFQKALAKYKNKEWDEAIKGFEESLELEYKRFPDLKGKKTNPSLIYIERCNQFKENPPPEEWDGVFTLTSK